MTFDTDSCWIVSNNVYRRIVRHGDGSPIRAMVKHGVCSYEWWVGDRETGSHSMLCYTGATATKGEALCRADEVLVAMATGDDVGRRLSPRAQRLWPSEPVEGANPSSDWKEWESVCASLRRVRAT